MANPQIYSEGVETRVADLFKSDPRTPARKPVERILQNIRVRLDDTRMTVGFTSKDSTGIVSHFTELMAASEHQELTILQGYVTRLQDANGSTFLIQGSPEELRAFAQTLEKAQHQLVQGEEVEAELTFDIYFRAKDRIGLLRQVTKVFKDASINMAHLLSALQPAPPEVGGLPLGARLPWPTPQWPAD